MLRILGNPRQLCDGATRREFLRAGGLGLAGLTLPQLWQLRQAAADAKQGEPPAHAGDKSFGRAKSIILLHLYGGPSQLETFDPKPDAPAEVRGELGSIESTLPGCRVCELLPLSAQVMDRTTVLRSMTHPYPVHGVAYALTGIPKIEVPMELSPRDPAHWPFFGSVVEFLAAERRQATGSPPPHVPNNVALPFPFSSRRVGEVPRAGPYAAFLGSQFDPLWTDFRGRPTAGITKTLRDMTFTDHDPYVGVDEDAHFTLPSGMNLPAEVTLDRLNRRRSLLDQLNHNRAGVGRSLAASQLTRHQASAASLLESDQLGKALDVRREDAAMRDLYGRTLFGQACLTARRLVEAGSQIVTVFWDEYGLAGSGWDTHWNHFERMRKELMPPFDRAWYGLITDLDRRGLLDETLVVCTSEHGRTPTLTAGSGGGRDHWSRAYTTLMAGGGVARGRIVGKTDKLAGDVVDRPISPKDQLATMYHLLGIDPETKLRDAVGRPLPLVEGQIIRDALA
jgi:hypothetical protein